MSKPPVNNTLPITDDAKMKAIFDTVKIERILTAPWRIGRMNMGGANIVMLSFHTDAEGWAHYAITPESLVALKQWIQMDETEQAQAAAASMERLREQLRQEQADV